MEPDQNGAVKVLITYASRMGSTAEIASAVADELRRAGLSVTLARCAEAPGPDGFDAVVCGSAIYATRWDRTARRWLRHHAPELSGATTWLFEGGPCGDQAGQRHETSAFVRRMAKEIGCDPPTVFGGNLDPARADSRMARWVANSDLAGDYRNWDDIRSWAASIANALAARRRAEPPTTADR